MQKFLKTNWMWEKSEKIKIKAKESLTVLKILFEKKVYNFIQISPSLHFKIKTKILKVFKWSQVNSEEKVKNKKKEKIMEKLLLITSAAIPTLTKEKPKAPKRR